MQNNNSKLNTILLIILIIIAIFCVWKLASKDHTTSDIVLVQEGKTEDSGQEVKEVSQPAIDLTPTFENHPYVSGKTYSYTNLGKTMTFTFLGYEDLQLGTGTKNLAAFSFGGAGKSYDQHNILAKPLSGTTLVEVQALTDIIGGEIISKPGDTWGQHYTIEIPSAQNIFDAIAFYKTYAGFEWVEPDFLTVGVVVPG